MNKRAQAGLEYLMTYGWALILVATVIGVLVFVITPPRQSLSFSASDPNALLVKGSSRDGTTLEVILQNISGGRMTITGVTLDSTVFRYSPVCLNNRPIRIGDTCTSSPKIDASNPLQVTAGGELRFTGITYAGSGIGTIDISYKDFAGLAKTATVSGGSGGGGPSGPSGTPVTACGTTIGSGGSYILTGNLGPYSGTCITITASDVTLNCQGNTITGNDMSFGNNGISISGDNVTVSNCIVTGFYKGISGTNNLQGITISNNIVNSNGRGVYLNYDADNINISGNTANDNTMYGFFFNDPTPTNLTFNSNTACGATGASVECDDPPGVISATGNVSDDCSTCPGITCTPCP